MKKFIRHEYDDIGRIYVFDDDSRYYSVTTILGNTKNKDFLEEWRKRMGRKRADAITKIAGETGTSVHELLELYLLKEESKTRPNNYIKNLTKQIIPYINKKVSDVKRTEAVLYSDVYKIAGTVDALVIYDGKLCILDFKTANKQPKSEWIKDYLLQLAIYAMMIEEETGTKIDYGCLLFAYKRVKSRRNEVFVQLDQYKEQAKKRIEIFQNTINA